MSLHPDPISLFAAWVGLVGDVPFHEAPFHASHFFARGAPGLTKTVGGAGGFLSSVPTIIAREREATTRTGDPGPHGRDPYRHRDPLTPPAPRRRDQQRAAA